MANDRTIGGVILAGSVIGVLVYGFLIFVAWETTLRLTAFLGVTIILAILAWIGYTMASTPPPEPLADLPEPRKPAGESKTEEKEAA
jgi:predicted DNA-binding transcriptional regulator